jgi:hypothetical protein
MYFNVAVGVKSGQRFTPLVAGDINGDGAFLNDRAFVFDPASITDPTVRASMQELLDNGAPAARKCLAAQLNSLAGRGSCQAPWVSTTNLNVNFNPQKLGLPKRLTINLSFTNPLGIADLLVNGTKNAKGWGQEIAPDQSLLFVRGFDASTSRYKYEVNQRFGSTRPQQSVSRTPAYASLSFSLDVGAPRERQILTQRLDMGRGRPGTKQTAPNLKALGSSSIPNPMALILTQQDSLKLNRKQADSLASLSRKFTQYADSVWTPVSKYLETVPDHYSRDEAYDRYVHAREVTVEYLIRIVPRCEEAADRLTAPETAVADHQLPRHARAQVPQVVERRRHQPVHVPVATVGRAAGNPSVTPRDLRGVVLSRQSGSHSC